ncbi:MAG TPA: histidine kinase dimerization/phospho-acceptor domain-containing protein [Candidatus Sulfotelmatobacter sp.]|nr:histidine kinase dimerization/phospho-acceptor domain-containing protein [Candidatus Sulfotelmatobacter sp.]
MHTRFKVWIGVVLVGLAAFVAAALILPQSFRLTAITDVAETLLLASGTASFVPLLIRSKGRLRLFWTLIILGLSFWLSYQLLWTCYEVFLRIDVPDLFTGDVILFLNIVPTMAALALRPHVKRDEYAARIGRLDLVLLLVWWLYLYFLIVIPWQYVVARVDTYNRNLNVLYLIEKLALLVVLAISWAGSKGHWRKLYASLFGMSLSYSAGSAIANWAIARNAYYSGSIYDVPLACSMAWLTWIGLTTNAQPAETEVPEVAKDYGVWVARCGMIAVFSLPLFATWAITDSAIPPRIRVFRLVSTLAAAFVMGGMVFLRQHLLDRELIQLLADSEKSFESLKRLQAQILQSEKLASIGQLVGGAAHELNNPITAMLGYSDMLLATELGANQQALATKIGHDVRHTKSLVASLISFARHAPAPKSPVDLNTLARTAIKITQSQWETLKIRPQVELDAQLPRVIGDSNQLLQVCLQLLGHALHSTNESNSVLTIQTKRDGPSCLLLISSIQTPASANQPDGADEAAKDGLGLSACQGILQEHGGSLSREQAGGALVMRVELPAGDAPLVKPNPATVPVLWQSRPFA